MAETRDPGVAGTNPFETGPSSRGGDVRPVKVDMGIGPPSPARAHLTNPHATRRGGSGAGIVLLSALLSVACGAGGAWAYEKYLAPSPSLTADNTKDKDKETDKDKDKNKMPDDGFRKELAGLEDRLKVLSERGQETADQYKQLRARLESRPTTAAPADLGAIEGKVAQVDHLADRVEALSHRVDPLAGQIGQFDRRISQLDERVKHLQGSLAERDRPIDRDREVSRARGDRTHSAMENPSGRAEPVASSTDPDPDSDSAAAPEASEPSLDKGEALFRAGKYSEAYAVFRNRIVEHPDDARNWYFAALSYGLATGEWQGITQTMVQEGVAREKVGHPARPRIDAAFDSLTRQTGKDWLAFYRRSAG